MHAHCLSQHTPLYISSFADQVLNSITVIAVNNILCDNRPFVQAIGDIVRCCTDQLNAALKCSLMRIGSDECGQETMVDIDDLVWIRIDKKWLQNLHITRQDQEIHFAF